MTPEPDSCAAKGTLFRNVFGLCTDHENILQVLNSMRLHYTAQELLEGFSSSLLSKDAAEFDEDDRPLRLKVCAMIFNALLGYSKSDSIQAALEESHSVNDTLQQELEAALTALNVRIQILYEDGFVVLWPDSGYTRKWRPDDPKANSDILDGLIVSIYSNKVIIFQELSKIFVFSLRTGMRVFTKELLHALESRPYFGQFFFNILPEAARPLLREQAERRGCYGLLFIAF
jgi:hypothetical protein